jgi:hypothetical protein
MIKDEELLETVKINKDAALKFRQRRHEDWTENYTLYRDKVIVNRLTQRQSVNVPLMKYGIKTIMKDIDDPPMLYFYNRDNDTQKEVLYNEYWNHCWRTGKGVVKDVVDKKQNLLFGRTFKKLNIVGGKFDFEIIDPQDMLIDRFVDPANLDTARFICQEHIFKPLTSLLNNLFYDKAAVKRLQNYLQSRQGLEKLSENAQSLVDKNQRLATMGLTDVNDPEVGEAYVELNEILMKVHDDKLDRDRYMFIVLAEDVENLANMPFDVLVGKTEDDYWMDHSNFVTWGEDVERTDFWSDGVADILRTPNKILNSWMSQLVENRTLRNYGMQYYNSTVEGFSPQTFEPVPWGWYPIPGNPKDMVQKIDIPDLSESLDEMQFILSLSEKATAATATQQGAIQPEKVTLGEIQLALQNAQERIKSMASLYTDSWTEFGTKYIKLLDAASDLIDEVDIYKKGKGTKHVYSKTVGPDKWATKSGYEVEVKDLSQSQSQGTDTLQKLNAAMTVMPTNSPLADIYKRKLLEFAELNANEVKEVMDAEKNALTAQPNLGGPGINATAGQPAGGQPSPQGMVQSMPPAPANQPMAQ